MKMKTKHEENTRAWLARPLFRLAMVLVSLLVGVSEVRAAILWNWVSEGEGNTFSGTLTTDGDYSMTLPGSGLVSFNVLSFDSWILNGTNLVTNGPFEFTDWQSAGTFTSLGGTVSNAVTWSRSQQKLDPSDGLKITSVSDGTETTFSSTSVWAFPPDGGSGPTGHAVLGIANADAPVVPNLRKNPIAQHLASGGEVFDLGFVPTSTVFTPVPEPKIYAGCAALILFLLVFVRRTRSRRGSSFMRPMDRLIDLSRLGFCPKCGTGESRQA